jgi:group I intron endonuclease
MEQIHYIYVIENKIDGKKYIGQTTDTKRRWNEHSKLLQRNSHKNYHLQDAWNEFGVENFHLSVLEEVKTENRLERELFYIQKFKTTDKNFGYNLAASTRKGIPHNKESIEVIRDSQRSIPVLQIDFNGEIVKRWRGGCRHASKYCGLQSSIWNCCNGNTCSYSNYIWIYEKDYDKFDLDYHLRNKGDKIVAQLDMNKNLIKIWERIDIAADTLGLDRSSISKVCRHKYSHAGGFIWEYYVNYKNNIITSKVPRKGNRKIVQLDFDGNEIKVWDSVSRITQILFGKRDNGSIKLCCENKKPHAYGYNWKYYDEK